MLKFFVFGEPNDSCERENYERRIREKRWSLVRTEDATLGIDVSMRDHDGAAHFCPAIKTTEYGGSAKGWRREAGTSKQNRLQYIVDKRSVWVTIQNLSNEKFDFTPKYWTKKNGIETITIEDSCYLKFGEYWELDPVSFDDGEDAMGWTLMDKDGREMVKLSFYLQNNKTSRVGEYVGDGTLQPFEEKTSLGVLYNILDRLLDTPDLEIDGCAWGQVFFPLYSLTKGSGENVMECAFKQERLALLSPDYKDGQPIFGQGQVSKIKFDGRNGDHELKDSKLYPNVCCDYDFSVIDPIDWSRQWVLGVDISNISNNPLVRNGVTKAKRCILTDENGMTELVQNLDTVLANDTACVKFNTDKPDWTDAAGCRWKIIGMCSINPKTKIMNDNTRKINFFPENMTVYNWRCGKTDTEMKIQDVTNGKINSAACGLVLRRTDGMDCRDWAVGQGSVVGCRIAVKKLATRPTFEKDECTICYDKHDQCYVFVECGHGCCRSCYETYYASVNAGESRCHFCREALSGSVTQAIQVDHCEYGNVNALLKEMALARENRGK